MPFRWKLRDGAGTELAEGGFDPGLVDLDPEHFKLIDDLEARILTIRDSL